MANIIYWNEYRAKKNNKKSFRPILFQVDEQFNCQKTVGNRKHRDIELVTTEKKNYLPSEPIYYSAKFFAEKLLAIEMRKTQIFMNKTVYLGL